MSDKKIAAKSGAGWKRWHHKSRIVLMLLGAVAVIVYLFQAGLAKQYAGLGAALCVIACGGFLVWHAIHLFTEEDAFDEQQLAATSSNPADKEQV
jgi:divalent metal cation (Fe/Co/Zn/Cd) transporter